MPHPIFHHNTNYHASSNLPSHYISCLTRPSTPAQLGMTPIRTRTLIAPLLLLSWARRRPCPLLWPPASVVPHMFRPGGVWGGKQRGGHCTDLFLFLWRAMTGTTTRNPRIQTWKLDLWSTYNFCPCVKGTVS